MIVNGWVLVAIVGAFVIGRLMRGFEIARLQGELYLLREKLRERGLGDPNGRFLRSGSVKR